MDGDQALNQSPATLTPAQQLEEQKLYVPDAGTREAFRSIWDRIYDTENHPDGTISFNRFSPDDFVRVMNIDNETFYWQALDPRDEEHHTIGNQYLVMKETIRKSPKLFSLPAGATAVLEGWNAAIMIEQLYKKIVAKRESERPLMNGQKIRNFAFSNPMRQDEYIDKIFVGKEKPTFTDQQITSPASPQQLEEIKADTSVSGIAKELGLDVKD